MPKSPPKQTRDESDSDSSEDEDYVPDALSDTRSDSDSDDSDDSDQDQNGIEDGSSNAYSTTRSGTKRRRKKSTKDASKQIEKPAVDEAQEQARKRKLDALWSEMNTPIKRTPLSNITGSEGSSSSRLDGETSSARSGAVKMVTITLTYDFAGEPVTVTKDVPENSKEAREYARKMKEANSNGSIRETSVPFMSTLSTHKVGPGSKLESKLESTSGLESGSQSGSQSGSRTDSRTESGIESEPLSESNLRSESLPESGSGPSRSSHAASAGSTASVSTAPEPQDTVMTDVMTDEVDVANDERLQKQDSRIRMLASIGDDPVKVASPVRYIRRESLLDELSTTYQVKKQFKLSTLEKTKMDWNQFVGQEGLEHELKQHNKNGYVEKQAFLDRAHARQEIQIKASKKRR
ncbi:swr complex subunit [Podila epigama]|nr:swr complex subunit [Podila epigama]